MLGDDHDGREPTDMAGSALASVGVGPEPARSAVTPANSAILPIHGHGASVARVFRNPAKFMRWISFAIVVVLPTVAAALYTLLWQTPQYIAGFRVSVHSVQAMNNVGLPSLLGLAGMSQSSTDSTAVVQYIQSHKLIDDMKPQINFTSMYANSSIDYFSRLSSSATIEEQVRYWNRRMQAYFETGTDTIIVKISAFSPQQALALATHVLGLSETFVNQMSERARSDTVAFAASEADRAKAKLDATLDQLRILRNHEAMLDPRQDATATAGLIAGIKVQLATVSEQLSVQRRTLNRNAPSVIATEAQKAALQHELARITGQTIATRNSVQRPLSTVFGAFEKLDSDRKFAEKSYQSALAALESARIDANRHQIYLETIVPPGLPQEEAFPRPGRDVLTVFSVALAIWIILMLTVAAIREHA